MKSIIKDSKGIVGVDIVIALSIMLLLAITIAAIYVNTNKNAISIQRSAKISETITSIFEKIDLMYYDNLKTTGNDFIDLSTTTDNNYKVLQDLIPAKSDGTKQYDIKLKVEEFTPDGTTNASADILKKITIKVRYEENGKTEEIVMDRLKYREVIIVPNKPVSTIDMTPIKKNSNGNWVMARESDVDWYNYENNNYAYAVKTEEVNFDSAGNMTFKGAETQEQIADKEHNNIWVWVPAFGLNSENECKYIYGPIKTGINNEYADKISKDGFTYYSINPEKIECIKFKDSNLSNDVGFEEDKYGVWLNIHEFTVVFARGTTTYEQYLKTCK